MLKMAALIPLKSLPSIGIGRFRILGWPRFRILGAGGGARGAVK